MDKVPNLKAIVEEAYELTLEHLRLIAQTGVIVRNIHIACIVRTGQEVLLSKSTDEFSEENRERAELKAHICLRENMPIKKVIEQGRLRVSEKLLKPPLHAGGVPVSYADIFIGVGVASKEGGGRQNDMIAGTFGGNLLNLMRARAIDDAPAV